MSMSSSYILNTYPDYPTSEESQSDSEYSYQDDYALSKKRINFVLKQASHFPFYPLNIEKNTIKNYDYYVTRTLKEIAKLSSLDCSVILPKLPNRFLEELSKVEDKVVLLDLDETLIYSDIEKKFPKDEYDEIVKLTYEGRKYNIGIFIRDGLDEFLKEVSEKFVIGVFTAAEQNYADSILDILDPEKKYIEFSLYRDSCIEVNGSFIKDLRIFKGFPLENIVLVENNLAALSNQLNNGILLNSFLNNVQDNALYQVKDYLFDNIYDAEDVREVNGEFFKFQQIVDSFNNRRRRK